MSEQGSSKREEIIKWQRKALQAKMDLHDLSEELPLGWETVLDVAKRVHESYRTLAELKAGETSA
jgi:hypothetical protein